MEPSKGLDPLSFVVQEPQQPVNRTEDIFLPMQVTLLGGGEIHVKCCSCCGKEHEYASLHRLKKAVMPYTHYFYCDLDGAGDREPVMLSIAVSAGEAMTPDPKILLALAEAGLSHRWMVHICWETPPINPKENPNPTIHHRRISRDFPQGCLPKAQEMILEDIGQLGGTRAPAPLKAATGAMRPSLELFAGDGAAKPPQD